MRLAGACFAASLAMRMWRPSEPDGNPTTSRVVRAKFETQDEREYLARVVDLMRDRCSVAREVGAAINVLKAGETIMVNVRVMKTSDDRVRVKGGADLAREVEVVFFDYARGLRETHQKLKGFEAECVQVALG